MVFPGTWFIFGGQNRGPYITGSQCIIWDRSSGKKTPKATIDRRFSQPKGKILHLPEGTILGPDDVILFPFGPRSKVC